MPIKPDTTAPLTRRHQAALDLLQGTHLKRIPIDRWMRGVHHATRRSLQDRGLVAYIRVTGTPPQTYATLITDPRTHDK